MKKRTLAALIFALVLMLVVPVVAATVDTAPAAEEVPVLDVAAKNLSLNNTIDLVFYVTVENGNAADARLMTWTAAPEDYAYGTEEKILEPTTVTTYKEKPCAIFYYTGLAAKQMADDVYVRAYVEQDGEKYFSDADKYSILQYAYNKIHAATPDASLVALLESMLDYGAQAQIYFDYNVGRLANADYKQIKIVEGLLADQTDRGLYLEGDLVTFTANAAAEGYKFSHWTNAAGESVGDTETLTLEVKTAETYTANYVEAVKYSEGLAYTDNGDGTLTVAGIGTCTDTDLMIPPTHEGKRVTAIKTSAFSYNSTIASVVIPNSVTSIGANAFWSCDQLISVTLGKNVESIGAYAFERCYKLLEVVNLSDLSIQKGYSDYGYVSNYAWEVHDGVSKIDNVDGYCFYTYNNVHYLVGYTGVDGDLVLPQSYKNETYIVGSYAFYNCFRLTSVIISEGVTSLDHDSFNNCYNITSLTIGNNVKSIGAWSFVECHGLTSIVVPDGVTSIESGAFMRCIKLTEITIPSSVSSIGERAFYECYKLENIVLPTNVKYIGKSAFSGCSSLTSIVIPNGVNKIYAYTFEYCNSLTNIVVPDSVKTIDYYAFRYCNNLSTITFEGSVEQWNNITKGTDWNYNTGDYTVYCTDGTIAKDGTVTYYYSQGLAYTENADGTLSVAGIGTCTDTDIIIPSEHEGKAVTKIGACAFKNCTTLTSVEIPDSVTSIGFEAFFECNTLVSVTIGNGVTSIDSWAFCDCNSLASVVIPDSVTSIGDYAFCDCDSLSSIVIPGSVTSIGDEAFAYCRGLKNVTIGNGIKSIGGFRYCVSLKNVVIPDSVTSIEGAAFMCCDSIESIVIPDSVTSIGTYAFGGCSSLAGVVFSNPDGWTWFDYNYGSLSGSDLSDPSTAATYLKSTYSSGTWSRN